MDQQKSSLFPSVCFFVFYINFGKNGKNKIIANGIVEYVGLYMQAIGYQARVGIIRKKKEVQQVDDNIKNTLVHAFSKVVIICAQ
jgi:hypothetical protein